MQGGRLIGQGSYGCVFNPPLLCKKKQMEKGKVGKVTREEDVLREIHAYNVLNKIKEAKDYFILADSSCTPKILDNQLDQDIDKCRFFNKVYESNLKQLSMPHGGLDLHHHTLHNKDISLFVLMKHLLEAGSLMLLHGFVHYDIHASNIVVDKFNVPRLIDFGQSFSVSEIDIDMIEDRWKILTPSYTTEPPEVMVLTAIDDNNDYSVDDAIHKILPKKTILKVIEKLLKVPVSTQLKNIEHFFNTSSAIQSFNLEKVWKLYYPGFDSWGIGCLLLEYISKLIYSYEFVESSEWKLKKRNIVDILRKMLDTNPKERIDCVEALSMFDPMNDIYQDYGIEWVESRRKQRRL